MVQEIIKGKHRILLTSPEMCLDHPQFSKLLRTSGFTKCVTALVLDECHCVSQWGENFRKRFGDLGKLRSYFPTSVPFLATSATLPPSILAELCVKCCFEMNSTFQINLGNDRPNITALIGQMHGAASNLNALDFVIDDGAAGKRLKRTIIFFNTRDLTCKGHAHLEKRLRRHGIHNRIGFLHAARATPAKRKVMKDFRKGRIDVLCATEAAGMVYLFFHLAHALIHLI